MALAIAGPQRYGDALPAKRRVTGVCRGENLLERLIRRGIDAAQTPIRRVDNLGFRNHREAACISVDDAAGRIDDEHCGRKCVETVSERRSLDLMQLDNLPD